MISKGTNNNKKRINKQTNDKQTNYEQTNKQINKQ